MSLIVDSSFLPAEWNTKTLEELCDIARGGSPRPIKQFITNDPDGVNWIKISDASSSSKYIYETKEKIKPEGIKRSRLVSEGDFILSNSMSFGRPYIMRTSGCIHDGWLVLKDKSGLFDQDYLYYFLGSNTTYEQFDKLAAGSTVRNLNIDLVKSVEVILPPLPEQKRIVAILDEVFAGIDDAIANTEKNLTNARELFESYLNTIFDGKGNGWDDRMLSEICDVRDGTHDSPKYVEAGIPFVTQKNIREDGLAFENTKFINGDDHEKFYARSNVAFGDILISMIGANRGMACLVDDKRTFSIKNVGLIKSSEKVNSKFLLHLLNSKSAKEYVKEASRGGAQSFIGLGKLRKFPVCLAPLHDQESIVADLDSLQTETQRLEAIYQQKLTALNELKQSILQKAFTGELTADTASQAEKVKEEIAV